jgi:hypothetical protein
MRSEKSSDHSQKKKKTVGRFHWIGSLLTEYFCIIAVVELDYVLVAVIYIPVKIRLFCRNHMQQYATDILKEIGFQITYILLYYII